MALEKLTGGIKLSTLFHFLTDLATDPKKQTAFWNTPDTVIEEAGLSEADKVMLKSGDKNKISAAFTSEFTVLAVACVDPGEDPLPDPDPPSEPDSPESSLKGNRRVLASAV
jgi:hypothetical protein